MSGSREDLLYLITELESKRAKPKLNELITWYRQNYAWVEPDDWERLQLALCETYTLTQPALDTLMSAPGVDEPIPLVDPFDKLVPPAGWFRDYHNYTQGFESPAAFHFFSAYTIFGAALRRQINLDMSAYRVWPAVRTIVTGPSGKVKKTTATNNALDIGLETKRVVLLAEKATPEAIHTELAIQGDPACGLLYAPELTTFLGKQEYNAHLIQSLTRLWDDPKVLPVKTIKRHTEVLHNVTLSFLAGSNEDWLGTSLPESAFTGGFMGRILLVHKEATARFFPFPVPPETSLHEEVLSGLLRTEFIKGEARLTTSARQYFERRYRELKKHGPEDERLAAFWERYDVHLLRMGMLLCIADGFPMPVIITDVHLEQADALLRWLTSRLPTIYAFIGGTPFGNNVRSIARYIHRRGGSASRLSIAKHMETRMSSRELAEALKTLLEAGTIVERRDLILRGSVVYELMADWNRLDG